MFLYGGKIGLIWVKILREKGVRLQRKINKKKPKEESFINEVEGFQAATLLREDSSTGAKF